MKQTEKQHITHESVRFLEGSWQVPRRFLEGSSKVLRMLQGTWMRPAYGSRMCLLHFRQSTPWAMRGHHRHHHQNYTFFRFFRIFRVFSHLENRSRIESFQNVFFFTFSTIFDLSNVISEPFWDPKRIRGEDFLVIFEGKTLASILKQFFQCFFFSEKL